MKIHIVMAQRKCSYPGEYGEESIGVMTEYEYDDNPSYLDQMVAEARKTEEYDAVEMITLTVDDQAIKNALFPKREPIPATVS